MAGSGLSWAVKQPLDIHHPAEHNFYSALYSSPAGGGGIPILDMGLINKVDMVCLSPVGYGV